MPGLRFTLSIEGDVQIDRTLARFAENLGDARPLWNVLADRFVRMEVRQFSSEGSYGSGGWPALSPRYAAWKAKAYPGKTILRRTDDLYNSLTRRPLGIEILEHRSMTIGSGVEHLRYHQLGDGVPQRRAVELPEGERRYWMGLIQRFVVTGVTTKVY